MSGYGSFETDVESQFEDEDAGEYGEYETDGEWELSDGESETDFEAELDSEEESELALAQELLAVSSEAELEEFLGKLVKGAGRFLKSKAGRAVTGVLRGVAKTALPVVGSALGSFVLPGVGTAIGGKLGSLASKLLEVEEAEVLGEAEAELEAARRFVRFGRATIRYGAAAPRTAPPRTIARSAAVTAARRYAPALLRDTRARPARSRYAARRARAQRWSAPRRRRPPRWQWSPDPWAGPWPVPVRIPVQAAYGAWTDPYSLPEPDWGDPGDLGDPGDAGYDGDDTGGFESE